MTEYILNRSKRKTVALYVRDGVVEVRAPLKTPKHEIDRFVNNKEKWINDKLAITGQRAALRESFTLDYGKHIAYRGRKYPIAAKEGDSIGFDDEQFYMPSELTSEQIKASCILIYKMLAKRDLSDRLDYFAQKMSAYPASVKITNARTRWGSCSAKKRICFSWRIIMADDDIIDYIVVHELAHLTELNHSERFWKTVENVLPDYLERRALLNEFHERISLEDW